jgi:hypothetical protein
MPSVRSFEAQIDPNGWIFTKATVLVKVIQNKSSGYGNDQ